MWGCKKPTTEGAITIGIVFSSSSQVYYFATLTGVKVGQWTEVKSSRSLVKVKVVSVEEGIKPGITKWRTGAMITERQREENPYEGEDKLNNSLPTMLEVQTALSVISQLQKALSESSTGSNMGFSSNLGLHVSREAEIVLTGVSSSLIRTKTRNTSNELKELLNFLNFKNSAKQEARERLIKLEQEAAEIRKLLES